MESLFIFVKRKWKKGNKKTNVSESGSELDAALPPSYLVDDASDISCSQSKDSNGNEDLVPVLHSSSPSDPDATASPALELEPQAAPIQTRNAVLTNHSTLCTVPEHQPLPSTSPSSPVPLDDALAPLPEQSVTPAQTGPPTESPSVGIFGSAQQFAVNGGNFTINFGSASQSHSSYEHHHHVGEQPVVDHQNQTTLVTGTDSEIYARLLLPKRHGYPLWIPEPYEGLASEYTSKGVQVGDVGVVNDDGGFEYLFNVCHDANSPVNCDGVPSGFTPFPLCDLNILQQFSRFHKDDHIASSHIRKAVTLSTGIPNIHSEISFTTSRSEGAILVLPEGARRINARNLAKLRQYAIDNAVQWYEYANGQRGWEIQNDALYLITGCDKCTCWALASFSDASAEGTISLELLTVKGEFEGAESLQYIWKEGCSAAVRTGPHYEERHMKNVPNQCVFVRGYKIAIDADAEKRGAGGAVLSSVLDSSPDSFFSGGGHIPFGLDSGHFSGSGAGASGVSGSRAGGVQDCEERPSQQVHLEQFPERRQLFHPSDIINHYLLSTKNTSVAITHDDEWCSVLKEDEAVLPGAHELLHRVLSCHTVQTTNHAKFLEPLAHNDTGMFSGNVENETTEVHQKMALPPKAKSSDKEVSESEESDAIFLSDTPNAGSQQLERTAATSGFHATSNFYHTSSPHELLALPSSTFPDNVSSASRNSSKSSSSFRSALERAKKTITRFSLSSQGETTVPAKQASLSILRKVRLLPKAKQLIRNEEVSRNLPGQTPLQEFSFSNFQQSQLALGGLRHVSMAPLSEAAALPPFMRPGIESSSVPDPAQRHSLSLSSLRSSTLERPASDAWNSFTALPRPHNTVRDAISMLRMELADPPAYTRATEAWTKEWEQTEARMRPLVEDNSSIGNSLTATDERECELFAKSIKDGYILCQLMNKIQAKHVLQPDVEDELSNLMNFRSACLSFGLAPEDVFSINDMTEASKDSITRVASTIVTLINFAHPHIPNFTPTLQATTSRTSSLLSSETDLTRCISSTDSWAFRSSTSSTVGTSFTSLDLDPDRSLNVRLGKGRLDDGISSSLTNEQDDWQLHGSTRSSLVSGTGSMKTTPNRLQNYTPWKGYGRTLLLETSSHSSLNSTSRLDQPHSVIETSGRRTTTGLTNTPQEQKSKSVSSFVDQTLVIAENGNSSLHLQLDKCFAHGSSSAVYRARNLQTGAIVALKRTKTEDLTGTEIDSIRREVNRLRDLSHPNIVQYLNVTRDADTLDIVIEYVHNGSLDQSLKAFSKLNEQLAVTYMVKIMDGLQYLHQNCVIHGNLKASNILTTTTGDIKLSNFGLPFSRLRVEAAPNWTAPEVLESSCAFPTSDVWSLACTTIELLTGRPPYDDIPQSTFVMQHIIEDDMPPIPANTNPLLEDFLKLCFNKTFTRRPNVEMLAQHEWLKYTREQSQKAFDVPSDANYLDNKKFKARSDSQLEHVFVKTVFSKPMTCRVCHLLTKSGIQCTHCSLICHLRCAENVSASIRNCDQRLQYSQYAERRKTISSLPELHRPLSTGYGSITESPEEAVSSPHN